MEACPRGFSFMPEYTTESVDLKYVEGDALERTWRTTRRERLKQQEQRIWEEFVKEEDIIQNICKEDPYQFLNQLPEACIKELLELELQKMNQEKAEEIQIDEQLTEPSSPAVEVDNQHTVIFSEVVDNEDSNMINIFDDDKDEDDSGPEEEVLNDSVSSPPCTVREMSAEITSQAEELEDHSADKTSRKSSGENITNMIESSIYCAKVKDIRLKINDELLNIIGFLEKQNVINIDPSDVPKMMKRSVEFSTRFNRVHMYQLQRQVGDVERNTTNSLPYAQRTHFQAQLVRVSSLHQNLLNAVQVFHKSLQQTFCMKESGDLLRAMMQLIGRVSLVCSEARPPALAAATDLYNDSLQSTCDKLAETFNKYSTKMSDYLNNTENKSVSCSRKTEKGWKKSSANWCKFGNKSSRNAEARLSMYSLDALRTGLNSKQASKSNHSNSVTPKTRANTEEDSKRTKNEEDPPKSAKKTPRNRRPLMRGPSQRMRRSVPREQDVRTLVESVAPCTSSHISREPSPYRSPKTKNVTPRLKCNETTQKPQLTNSTLLNNTPRNKMAPTKPIICPKNPKTPREDIVSPKSNIDSSKDKQPINTSERENSKIRVKEREKNPEQQKPEADLKQTNEEPKSERDKYKSQEMDKASCEVTKLVRQLCGGDNTGNKRERMTGAKNAQLLCINGGSPRQPSTPQLLRILEETIQKKAPKPLFPKLMSPRDAERFRMAFNIPESATESLFSYRTRFVQHMLTSPMYANSTVGKPWEKIGSVSNQIIDDLLLSCAKEMELQKLVKEIYKNETR